MFKSERDIFKIIKNGTINELEEFVKANPDCLNERSGFWSDKRPPLSYAITHKKTEFAKKLLELGANPNEEDAYNNLALHHAAATGNEELLTLLLSRDDVDINAHGHANNTALHYAAFHNQLNTLKCLIKNGAKLNLQNKDGHTALHKAASFSRLPVYKALLLAGIDRTIKNNAGKTASQTSESTYIRIVDSEIDALPQNTQQDESLATLSEDIKSGNFVQENESAVSITKVFEASATIQKIIYDFSDETITTITTEPTGKAQCVNAFKNAASLKQLKAAAEYLETQGGNTYSWQQRVIV